MSLGLIITDDPSAEPDQPSGGARALLVDRKRRLWVRLQGLAADVLGTVVATGPSGAELAKDASVLEQRPAQTSDAITPSGTALALTFRALRIDIAAGGTGTITCNLKKADGTTDSGRVLNVAAGEILPYSSACVLKITAASAGVTIFALG